MTAITVGRLNSGDLEAHRAGCGHLNGRRFTHDPHPWTFDADSLDDITFEIWGESGVASDNFDGNQWTERDRYRTFTITEYDGAHGIGPCLRHLPQTTTSLESETS